jgi:DNA-binding MarR family transcriptional regulator
VIGITAGHGSVSFKRVATAANLEKSYASRVVSALVERGIIEKQANPSDSRSVLLQLTAYGKEVHGQTYALALALNDLLQSIFTPGQVDDFLAFLSTLEQQLDRAAGAVEGGDIAAAALIAAPPPPESDGDGVGQTYALDRNFARQLHDLLGRYLASE